MKYEKEFREAHPETIGETNKVFDLCNYVDWLECEYEELELTYSEKANNTWAKKRHDACMVREAVAIRWMLKVYCDVEVTDEVVEEAISEFRSKFPL